MDKDEEGRDGEVGKREERKIKTQRNEDEE